MVLAFVVAGLREIGKPTRKALIVDLARETARGRAVGMYYLVQGLVVLPASLIGGWLWTISPRLPFYTFLAGVAGFLVYAVCKSEKSREIVDLTRLTASLKYHQAELEKFFSHPPVNPLWIS